LAGFKGEFLELRHVAAIDVDTARELAEFKGSRLSLNSVKAMDAATARAIAKFRGEWGVELRGLANIDAETLSALKECRQVWLPR
jgi:hypothetical protein